MVSVSVARTVNQRRAKISYTALARSLRPNKFRIGRWAGISCEGFNLLSKVGEYAPCLFVNRRKGCRKNNFGEVNSKSFELRTVLKMAIAVAHVQLQKTLRKGLLDVIELDAASNRGVEEIQTFFEQLRYPPSLGKMKVIIIDEVHMLSSHAFNSMLKTLEEPPNYVVFVLATTELNKVPLTVVSRCVKFSLQNIPTSKVHDYLVTVFEKRYQV
ncbi:MAG: hypothetical protein CM15mP58_00180 [Burkholderiaceae bacterium]|nr:MAG: hypothetical protein CM15mP58_00180 [Burkholderiaceae bacterium]